MINNKNLLYIVQEYCREQHFLALKLIKEITGNIKHECDKWHIYSKCAINTSYFKANNQYKKIFFSTKIESIQLYGKRWKISYINNIN